MFFDYMLLDAIAKGIILSALGLFWIVLLVRIVGLRSFSKMTNFDFVVTVAMGSLLASAATSTNWASFVHAMAAMAALMIAQVSLAIFRQRSDHVDDWLQNKPVLLMRNGKVNHEALRRTRVTKSDLIAKLREANALDVSAVRAVVLETTGDVSVLYGYLLDQELIADITQIESMAKPDPSHK